MKALDLLYAADRHEYPAQFVPLQLSFSIDGIDEDHSLCQDNYKSIVDNIKQNHHPIVRGIALLVGAWHDACREISVMSSLQYQRLSPVLLEGKWSNRQVWELFNFNLYLLGTERRTNCTVIVLVDYTRVKRLYVAKEMIMPTLKKEKMFLKLHPEVNMTCRTTKIGFLTKQHPQHVHLALLQKFAHEELIKVFLEDFDHFSQIDARYNKFPIHRPENLPPPQFQQHKINPLLKNNGFDAINVHVPDECCNLFRALFARLASRTYGWEFCNTAML